MGQTAQIACNNVTCKHNQKGDCIRSYVLIDEAGRCLHNEPRKDGPEHEEKEV
jgi:hypothetical protein